MPVSDFDRIISENVNSTGLRRQRNTERLASIANNANKFIKQLEIFKFDEDMEVEALVDELEQIKEATKGYIKAGKDPAHFDAHRLREIERQMPELRVKVNVLIKAEKRREQDDELLEKLEKRKAMAKRKKPSKTKSNEEKITMSASE